ncbi:MAG: hypothetical protein Q9216_006306 [Gyalolechia sp. 2 TL-2023]
MSASSFLERSKASLEELRGHVPALRARASSSSLRLHVPCIGVGIGNCTGGAGISRSFTAPGQSLSARRGALDHGNTGRTGGAEQHVDTTETAAEQLHPSSISSPIEVQQFRAIPAGYHYYRTRSEERLVPANGNPDRDDEYSSYLFSSRGRSERRGSSDGNNDVGGRENSSVFADAGLAADVDARMRSREIRRAYTTGNDAWTIAIENSAQARQLLLPSSRVQGTDVPVWEIDVEAQLEGEVQRLIGARDYRFEDLVAERIVVPYDATAVPAPLRITHAQPPPLTPQPRPHPPHHNPSKRKARILNPEIDYSILHPSPPTTPHSSLESEETIQPSLLSTSTVTPLHLTPPPPPLHPSIPGADSTYTQTDTSQHNTLITPAGRTRTKKERKARRLPRPPPPTSSARQLDIVNARVLDAGRGGEGRCFALAPSVSTTSVSTSSHPPPRQSRDGENRSTKNRRRRRDVDVSREISPPVSDPHSPPPTIPDTSNDGSSADIKPDSAPSIRGSEHADPSSPSDKPSPTQQYQREHHHNDSYQDITNRDRLQQQAASLLTDHPPLPTTNMNSGFGGEILSVSPPTVPSTRLLCGGEGVPLITTLPPIATLSPISLPQVDGSWNSDGGEEGGSMSTSTSMSTRTPTPAPTAHPSLSPVPLSLSLSLSSPGPSLSPLSTPKTPNPNPNPNPNRQEWRRLTLNTTSWPTFPPGEWVVLGLMV